MSVLMFIDLAGDGQWPSGYSVNRFASIAASNGDGRRPVAVFAYSRPETTLVDAVAQEFALSACHGHRVRAVLVGVRDHRLAERLYRERGLPVNVVFGTPEVDVQWSDALGRFRGITMSGWLRPRPTLDDGDENDEDVVTSVVDALNNLSDCYQSYTAGLRDVPSFAAHCGPSSLADYAPAYTAIADAFGDGVQDVEPLLDAMLEELCGAAELSSSDDVDTDNGDGRWMATIVEYGDRAAENASNLLNHGHCNAVAAADFKRRTDRAAASFASSFWRDVAGQPTTTDRALSDCLVGHLRSIVRSTDLGDLSAQQFAICLNAKFIGSRRWDRPGNIPSASLFRPAIREVCERFTGVRDLLDLMAAGDGDDGDRVFGSGHVEHMEPHVMTQRLVDYASSHYHRRVRYFALDDTLVFKFTDGVPGDLSETHNNHRFVGPKDFRDFHFELFKTADYFRHEDNGNGDSNSNHRSRLPADDYPNAFVYRDFGYTDMDTDTVHYVSANGHGTAVSVESYRLNGTTRNGDFDPNYERKDRVKVKCDEFWAAVHGIGTPAVELTVGLGDGTVVAVTQRDDDHDGRNRDRRNEGFHVVVRSPDGGIEVADRVASFAWPVSRPLLTCGHHTADVAAADGTKTTVDFVNSACEVFVSDGAKLRLRSGVRGRLEFCRAGAAARANAGDDDDDDDDDDDGRTSAGRHRCKYVVCRRDMSGYEFVEGGRTSERPPDAAAAAAAVRTLTRSRFDGRTSGQVDELLADCLKTVETLAGRLNAEFSDADEFGPEESPDLGENSFSGSIGYDFGPTAI